MTVEDHQPSALWQERFTVVRLISLIWMSGLILRTFVAEPSHIPTGSMAPHRLGLHQNWLCSNCKFPFTVGVKTNGGYSTVACPNCAVRLPLDTTIIDRTEGDRVWVDKATLALVQPKRWQEVVFFSPDAPLIPHLKRVAGAPGESVWIDKGDVFIDGKRIVKNDDDRKALSVLVYDLRYPSVDALRYPRWQFLNTDSKQTTGWAISENQSELVHKSLTREAQTEQAWDWANYRHICPDRGEYGPVRDFLAYEGIHSGGQNEVGDFWFEAELDLNGCRNLAFRITTQEVEIVLEMNLGQDLFNPAGVVKINGETVNLDWHKRLDKNLLKPSSHEVSWVDHQLEYRIDGVLVFEPFIKEINDSKSPPSSFRDSPIGIGLMGSQGKIRNFRLFRDIYITNRLASEPVIGFGVREPVRLPPDGYFLLGDNSGFSLDSRFWKHGPVVPRSAIIGRPIGKGR